MRETYDRVYSEFYSNNPAFQKAHNRIDRLNKKYLHNQKLIDLNETASLAVKETLCSKCPEDHELCENDRDNKSRYCCKLLSQTEEAYVRLYFPSQNNKEAQKDRIKQGFIQTVTENPGIIQVKLFASIPGDKKLKLECLKELTAQGPLRCFVQNRGKHYDIIHD